MARRVTIVAALLLFVAPAVARANGDPASDYLLVQSIFLPFNAKVDPSVSARLAETIRAANRAKFKIKVAIIGSRYDLGTAFSLYNQPQKYAQFLGLELSFQFRDRLLVVMPKGYGFSIRGKTDAAGVRVVAKLPPPGKDATKEADGATKAIRKLALASGIQLSASVGGTSKTRDRITIAAGAVAFAALLAAIVFWRRERPREKPTPGV